MNKFPMFKYGLFGLGFHDFIVLTGGGQNFDIKTSAFELELTFKFGFRTSLHSCRKPLGISKKPVRNYESAHF
jgi:hypothetical protein